MHNLGILSKHCIIVMIGPNCRKVSVIGRKKVFLLQKSQRLVMATLQPPEGTAVG